MKRFLPLLLILLASAFSAEIFTTTPAKASDKENATLRGVINEFSFPVPDEVELGTTQSAWVLATPNEVECQGKIGDEDEPVKATLDLFHLVVSEQLQGKIAKFRGKPVEITGRIIPAHTRHHRTAFLLNVESVKELGK